MFDPGDFVTIAPVKGGEMQPAVLRIVSVEDRAVEALHLRGAPLKAFFAKDRVSVILDLEDKSMVWEAAIVEVRFPDRLFLRTQGIPEERKARDFVRIEDFLCVEYKVRKGDERTILDQFKMQGVRKPPLQLSPPSRFTQNDDRSVLEELEKEILKVIVGMDQKIDAIVRFLAEGDRKLLQTFTPQRVTISGSGIGFAAAEAVSMGDHMEVRIHLPDAGGVPVRVLGVVVRAKASPKDGGTEVGLHYRHIEEEDRDRIVRYIFSRQREAIRSGEERKGGGKGVQ